ncbi:uncharacterized protein LOC116430436 [Nomia melanderi]|uniref:uncharacterized protein LOC116430436 n=1 Tax=Nomia melanderi TaxID=2448451 RepID=UPI003FCE4223
MEEHFASLRLLDSDNDNKLTRAFSYSELPSSQRVCLAQTYHSGNSLGLVRQYSCEQIFDQTAKARQLKLSGLMSSENNKCKKEWQSVITYSDACNTPEWQFCSNSKVMQASNHASNNIEYMEIEHMDISKESVSLSNDPPINITTKDTLKHLPPENRKSDATENRKADATEIKNTNSYQDVKKKLRPLVTPKAKDPVKKKMNSCCCNLICLCALPIVVAIIALFLNPITYTVCNRAILFSTATLELQEKLYGQENTIKNIASALQNDIEHLKVICLIGGTGIGKSYTAEIIIKNFPLEKKVYVHDVTLGHDLNEKILNSFRSYELLIIENLKMKDFDIFLSILDTLKGANDKCITVFAIFNVENINEQLTRDIDLLKSSAQISQVSADKMIDISVIPYAPMNEEALKMCIRDEAAYSNLKLSESQINEVLQSLLLSGSGCKGAYAKVQVIGRE